MFPFVSVIYYLLILLENFYESVIFYHVFFFYLLNVTMVFDLYLFIFLKNPAVSAYLKYIYFIYFIFFFWGWLFYLYFDPIVVFCLSVYTWIRWYWRLFRKCYKFIKKHIFHKS